MKKLGLFCFILSFTFSALAGGVFNDKMPIPDGACQDDHAALIAEFAQKQFRSLQEQGKVGIDDEFDGFSPLRQKADPNYGESATPYHLDMYGQTPEDQRIPPVDENDNPNGTREYRCFGRLVVTSTCKVVMVPMDFMDGSKLKEQGRLALDEIKRQHEREGTEIPEDEWVGVKVSVPKVQGMTCNRPEALVMF